MDVHVEVVEAMDCDCWMCESGARSQFKTTMSFVDDDNNNVFNLCVEHFDACVTAALERHAAELAQKSEHWYLLPDVTEDDIEEEAKQWQTG